MPAPHTRIAASVSSPAVNPPVASRIQPIRNGPDKSPDVADRIHQRDAAGGGRCRAGNAVGSVQNGPSVPQIPNAAIDRVVSACGRCCGREHGEHEARRADQARNRDVPAPLPGAIGMRCRRSPGRSVAAMYGIADSSTTVADLSPLVDCTICGSQKLIAVERDHDAEVEQRRRSTAGRSLQRGAKRDDARARYRHVRRPSRAPASHVLPP